MAKRGSWQVFEEGQDRREEHDGEGDNYVPDGCPKQFHAHSQSHLEGRRRIAIEGGGATACAWRQGQHHVLHGATQRQRIVAQSRSQKLD